MAVHRTVLLFLRENWVLLALLATLIGVVVVVGPALWRRPGAATVEQAHAAPAAERAPAPAKSTFCPTVDAVYLWVNGTDPELQKTIAEVTGKPYVESGRLRDIPTLKYSVRALDTFVPWVRNVVFVTNGQRPTWLNTSNPRVRVVTHAEIFENNSSLPTFNSNAIEAQLARIPGLAPCWFYLNDDFFFGRPVLLDDYIEPDTGKQKLAFDTWRAPEVEHMKKNLWHRSVAHSNDLLNKHYYADATKPVRHNYEAHNIRLIQGRVISTMYERWRPLWLKTASRKFRAEDDLAFPFLYNNVVLEEFGGYSAPHHSGSANMYGSFTLDAEANANVLKRFRRNAPMSFCLNDGAGIIATEEQRTKYAVAVDSLEKFFNEWFPVASSVEKLAQGQPSIPLSNPEYPLRANPEELQTRYTKKQASARKDGVSGTVVFVTGIWITMTALVTFALVSRAVKAARHKTMFGALGVERDLEV